MVHVRVEALLCSHMNQQQRQRAKGIEAFSGSPFFCTFASQLTFNGTWCNGSYNRSTSEEVASPGALKRILLSSRRNAGHGIRLC